MTDSAVWVFIGTNTLSVSETVPVALSVISLMVITTGHISSEVLPVFYLNKSEIPINWH